MHNRTQLWFVLFALAFMALIVPSAQARDFNAVTKTVSLGEVPDGIVDKSLVISPDNARAAYMVKKGNRYCIYVDGKPEKEYARVSLPAFSPDSRKYAYVAQTDLDDGDHVQCVVVNGVEGGAYLNIKVDSILFSPDSTRLTYTAIDNISNTIVVDGVGQEDYAQVWPPVFSPDSKHIAYVAANTDELYVVVDGVNGKTYSSVVGNILWSPDSKHIAYQAELNGRMRYVVDGVESREYEVIDRSNIVFSPDSKHIACQAAVGDKTLVVLDGVEGKHYAAVAEGEPIFSPDSRRIVYTAWHDNDKVVVVENNKESREYDGISEGTPLFSATGKRLAYVGWIGEKKTVVTDGVAGKVYDEIWTPVFSADEKRVAYAAQRGDKWLVVTDGVEGTPFDAVGEPRFSTDGRRLAYRAQTGGKWVMVVNGVKGKPYDDMGEPYFSPDGTRLDYIAVSGDKMFMVDNGEEGVECDDILFTDKVPVFTPDGKHFVWHAQLNDKWLVLVDDWAGGVLYSSPECTLTEEDKACVIDPGGTEVRDWDDIITDPVFDSPTKLHFLAQAGDEIVRVDVEIQPRKK